jgi:hypothetical protein
LRHDIERAIKTVRSGGWLEYQNCGLTAQQVGGLLPIARSPTVQGLPSIRHVFNDGGRAAAGYNGEARDCVCRAIAIATSLDYRTVYDRVNEVCAGEQPHKRLRGKSSSRAGVRKHTTKAFLASLGWSWVPTMRIGQGCTVHLRDGELPMGRLIVQVSKHLCAVIEGVIHDAHDPSRGGTRCVYGYWQCA